MGYIFDFNDTISCDKWFEEHHNSLIARVENRLLFEMLKPARGSRLLDIGCGTGHGLMQLIEMGLCPTGIDPSPYMLDVAYKNVKDRADLHRGVAESLPFDDNSFDYSCFMTSLEFVENPENALKEAFRVTKDKVFLGVLNRYALKAIKRRIKGIFTRTIYNHARFFSIWELKNMVRIILGDVPVSWSTVCLCPYDSDKIISKIEHSTFMHKYPFGAFAGLSITLVPRFRTRPLPIIYKARQKNENAISLTFLRNGDEKNPPFIPL